MTPTARSLKWLRENGWYAAITERWIRFPDREHPGKMIMRRVDTFNFGDILCFHPGRKEIALVQVTTRAHQAERISKTLDIPECARWLAANGAVYVHGWAKVGERGKRKLWEVTIQEVTLIAGKLAVSGVSCEATETVESGETGQDSLLFQEETF